MNILKEVLKYQVYPAMGCTEPVSVALCAAYAAAQLDGAIKSAHFRLDPGTYKNGCGVRIPNTDGEKGNLLAAAMGLLIAKPELQMEILSGADKELLAMAKKLVAEKKVLLEVAAEKQGFYIEANLESTDGQTAQCVIAGSHTEVVRLVKNGHVLKDTCQQQETNDCHAFKQSLKNATLADLIAWADQADGADLTYIKKGVEMNLKAAEMGQALQKVGFYIKELVRKKLLHMDLITSTKILTACAADARMDGQAVPVMSSGESGNQGVVTILVPWKVGKEMEVPEEKILRSIALSHLLNGYVKVFTGELAPICGCAIAAGVGATAAIVYQQRGGNVAAMTLAINNIISDIGGMLCDGAKSGCALKVVSSADAAIRSAFMGINDYGITEVEGFVGRSAEETIQNLGSISTIGMRAVDPMIVGIMQEKMK
ncbi:MAG: serine dehydratase subunit alpha family protein [Elusimicrobiaceae bacterium]|nr:serine dehydratase subunit alpha family protein [Elusimicrobiaceae bacterium]